MSIKVDGDTGEVSHVDHVNKVCLSWQHLDGIVLAVIDEACDWDWGLPGLNGIVGHVGSGLVVFQKCGHLFMVPIREGHCHLFIEMIGKLRVVNNERSPQAVWVLALSMRVVPIGACLVNLATSSVLMLRQRRCAAYWKGVGEAAVRRHWALSCSSGTVHGRMPILVEPMPVKAGRLVAKVVVNGDDKVVSEVNIYLRTRPFTIDSDDRTGKSSIGIPVDPVDAPIILDDLCECKLAAAQQQETQGEHGS